MDSSSFLVEALNKDDEYIINNINSILPALQKCLQDSTDEVNVLRAIGVALSSCMIPFNVQELEENLLQHACPAATQIFINTLQGIANFEKDQSFTQTDIPDTLTNLLNVCIDIIIHLQKAVQYLLDQNHIKGLEVKSLIICTAEVLNESYDHCSKCKEVYGTYFTVLSETLNQFLKESYNLQVLLLNLLLDKMEFKSELSDDLNVLDVVLKYLFRSAILLKALDPKKMADLWKCCIAITGRHLEHLKVHFDISETISCLCSSVVEALQSAILQQQGDIKAFSNSVKISAFILKIIIKLCEQFFGYLGDCHNSLITLLITLCKYNQSYLNYMKAPENVTMEVTRQLTIGYDPLLSQLLGDRGFINSFCYCSIKKDSGNMYGFLLVCCSVMKKLMHSNIETRHLWLTPESSIVKCIFMALPDCQYELCSSLLMTSVQIPGQPKRMTDLYEHALVATAAFTMSLSSKEFPVVEQILLKNVLQTNPWSAIFAIDIWCLLARFADSELCYTQLLDICKMFLQFSATTLRPEKLYLGSLARRLYPLMSLKHKESFTQIFPVVEVPHLWRTLGIQHLNPDFQHSLKSAMFSGAEKMNKVPTTCDDGHFLNAALLRLNPCDSHIEINGFREVEEDVVGLWSLDFSQICCEQFLRRYVEMASSNTVLVIPFMKSDNLFTVLKQIHSLITTSAESCIMLCAATIISELATVAIPAGPLQVSIMKIIAFIFDHLMTSDSIFIRQRTLEIFSHFAHVTKHPYIITQSVNNSNILQSEITNYLQKKHPLNRQSWDVNDYLIKLSSVQYQHSCKVYNYESDVIAEPIFKKPRLSEDLNLQSTLNRINEDMKCIIKAADSLSNCQRIQIRDIAQRLLRCIPLNK